MRNVSIIICIGFVFLSCSSSPAKNSNVSAPVFDKPHAIVLDMWSYGKKYEDYVRVYNSTSHENIAFNVFGYDEKNKTWLVLGVARLKQAADRDTVDSPFNGKIKPFRWFAVQSLNDLNFTAQAVIKNNDILITVFE